MNKMSVLELSHLTKIYKNNRGIKDLSLNIEKGQVYGLLGPNGSGKTTTMKILTGLVHPDSGSVKIFGYNPSEDFEKAMQSVGCMIENPGFYPYLTAKQNLEIARKLYPNCAEAAVEHILEQVGLLKYQNEKAEKYSLGMKQRLGLAMALISEPEFIILDEPMNGLDIEGMALVRNIIKNQAQKGRTILISSHLANEIEQVCTHAAIIREGVLLNEAKVPELLSVYGSIENYYLSLVKDTDKGDEMQS